MSDRASYFRTARLDCMVIETVLGKKLGEGAYRTVYELQYNPTKVCKVELRGDAFANVEEFDVWSRLKDTKWAKFLAPIHSIDQFGAVMIQERTTPLTDEQWFGFKRIPNFITDLKKDNFGMLDGRVVAHDYGLNLIRDLGMNSLRIKAKPSWANTQSRL